MPKQLLVLLGSVPRSRPPAQASAEDGRVSSKLLLQQDESFFAKLAPIMLIKFEEFIR